MNILNDLIKINTINDLENAKIRKYIKDILTPLNFTFTVVGSNNAKVLIAKRGQNNNLGFVCHTDTVSASPSWTKNPFLLTKEEDKLYGLGASDMKGGIAALLEVIKELDINIPLSCYFTFDEEIGFKGITTLLKEENNFPKTLIFPEPTDNMPVIANKGCLEFKCQFKGISTHSSTPMLGENAIYKAISFIDELKKFAQNLTKEENDIYEIPTTTFNLATIKGGDVINKVPNFAEITFDFRTINREQESKIIGELQNLAQKYSANLEIINNIPCAICHNQKFQEEIANICNQEVKGLNYVTEASFFTDKNILILGPGPITAHQKDEYITLSSYNKTKELYKKIILNFANKK